MIPSMKKNIPRKEKKNQWSNTLTFLFHEPRSDVMSQKVISKHCFWKCVKPMDFWQKHAVEVCSCLYDKIKLINEEGEESSVCRSVGSPTIGMTFGSFINMRSYVWGCLQTKGSKQEPLVFHLVPWGRVGGRWVGGETIWYGVLLTSVVGGQADPHMDTLYSETNFVSRKMRCLHPSLVNNIGSIVPHQCLWCCLICFAAPS